MRAEMKRFLGRAARTTRRRTNSLRARGKPKIFCIGRNKTGTTSLARAFRELGFTVGDQRRAEILYDTCFWRGDFAPILDYCRSAQVFQDVPFSVGETFKHLDDGFTDAKFILSIRESPEVWYESLIRFHSRVFGDGCLPSAIQLKAAEYVRHGWAYDNFKRHYGTPDDNLYDRDTLIANYITYNRSVIHHFAERPGKLLVIDLSSSDSWSAFREFLGLSTPRISHFPHENRTPRIPT